MRYTLALAYITLFSSYALFAQQDTAAYCLPGVLGQGPPKGLEINYFSAADYDLRGQGLRNNAEDFDTDVQRNRKLFGKVRLPLWHRPGFKMYVGFSKQEERYGLENEGELDQNSSIARIDDQLLKSSSLSLYGLKPIRGNHWYYTKLNISWSQRVVGDNSSQQLLNYGLGLLYGVKRSERLAYGFGISINRRFGNTRVFPIFVYNRTFNSKWGIELNLPASAKLRYNQNEGNIWYLMNQFKSDNYNVDLSLNGVEGTYFLERLEMHSKVRYERQVHDFLWVGFEAGMRFGYRLNLVDVLGPEAGDDIIVGGVSPAFQMGGSIFLVPPKKWRNK